MADVITRFKVETAEYDRKIGQSKKCLDEFRKSGKGAGDALKDFTGMMGLSIGSLTTMTAAVGAASAAIAIAKDAFTQSESNIDEWGRTVEGAKGAYDYFLQSINNGNWSNFFSNLNEAIRGSRDLYDTLDRLGSIKANNQAAIALTQKDIQDLKLRKQNGEMVDTELAAATERLAKLQGEEVEAGIKSGTDQMILTLKNAGIAEDMARAAAEEIARGGQAVFDKYAQIAQDLTAAGTSRGHSVSRLGGLINYYQEGSFSKDNLTGEQRKMYELATAITERETALQQGIATFAQAVQQGTASGREQFKNVRFTQSGGGGGGKSTGITIDKPWSKLKGKYTDSMRSLGSITAGQVSDPSAGTMLASAAANIDTSNIARAAEEWQRYQDALRAANEESQKAYGAIGSIGSALEAIGDPAAKVLGIVMEAVANVALAFSKSLKGTATPWDFIAGAAAGTATMISTISSIKSATAGSYADGGIIPGNRHSGDMQVANVNAGELILNRAQQGNLASQLSQQTQGRREVEFRISGQELVGILRQESNIRSYR